MNKKVSFLIIFASLLCGCGTKTLGSKNTSSGIMSSTSSEQMSSSVYSSIDASSSSVVSHSSKSDEKPSSISYKSSSASSIISSTSKGEHSFKYSLEDWTKFSFYEGARAKHNQDWSYYYGSSLNPNGVLFNSPDDNGKGSGVHFEKYTQYMESPIFKSWNKIEFHFSLWFSSKTSSSYKAKDNAPQIILEHRKGENKIGQTEVELKRSDVPSNSTCYDLHLYIRENEMDNLVFRFNNTIPNGNSGYTIVVHEISIKGWDYE